MASVRYIVLAACQRAGLVAQAGFENEAASWIRKQGSTPCAYVGYRRGIGVPGYDNVSVLFGGSEPQAALRRVREELDKSLEFRSETKTTVDGYPALVMTARVRKRVYNIFGGGFSPAPAPKEMYLESVDANSTVSMTSTLSTAPSLEYSTDGGKTWQEWQHTTSGTTHVFDIITLGEVGDRVYLRGENPSGLGSSSSNYSNITLTGSVNAGGNIMSLLDKSMELTTVPDYGFYRLFRETGSSHPLLTPPSMDTITSIGNSGLHSCFNVCSSLVTAPDFSNVTSIGDYGLNSCFKGCSSLVTAPDFSNVTSIGNYGLGYCFDSCSSLVTAPDFSNVTSIGNSGLNSCFYGCSKLGDVTAPNISDITSSMLSGWLTKAGTGVTGTKVVRVPLGATITENSDSGIPTGWTRVDY